MMSTPRLSEVERQNSTAHQMAETLRRAVELTEACLTLRAATLAPQVGKDSQWRSWHWRIRFC